MSAEQIGVVLVASRPTSCRRRSAAARSTTIDARLVLESRRRAACRSTSTRPAGISIAQLATRARRLKRQHGIGLIIVDYLQLMTRTNAGDNRVAEVDRDHDGAEGAGQGTQRSGVALSQLSPRGREREDKRPQLADLRESGSIEQDADIVLSCTARNTTSNASGPTGRTWSRFAAGLQDGGVAGKAEIIIGKYRHGPLGTAVLHYDPVTMTFSDGGTSS